MFNFLKRYKLWFTVSAVVVAAAAVSLIVFGLNLGIDFKGGTLTQVRFEQNLPSNAEIKAALAEIGLPDAVIQPLEGASVIVRTGVQEKAEHDRMLQTLRDKFGSITEEQFTSIGPVIGKELRSKALWQLILVSLGIIFYIAYAFRKVAKPVSSWRFGMAAIVALLHDLMIVLGVFSLLGRFSGVEVDSLFVTALLTVLGFSVHDTIVVFDRIRENLRLYQGDELFEIIRKSINETLVRSINTSATVILVLASLMLFGGDTIFYFVLALLVGIIVGTYSSIFIASPLLLVWHNRDLKKRA